LVLDHSVVLIFLEHSIPLVHYPLQLPHLHLLVLNLEVNQKVKKYTLVFAAMDVALNPFEVCATSALFAPTMICANNAKQRMFILNILSLRFELRKVRLKRKAKAVKQSNHGVVGAEDGVEVDLVTMV
jgi:hypothetical protein